MQSLSRPPASEQPGLKKLGRYECTEQVGGDGGFETYRARVRGLTGLDRSFAVKVLRLKRSEAPSAVSEPFLHAAKRSAAVANPRIATVVEADAGEGLVFAATPFMEGLDLGRFLGAARDADLLATGKDDKARHWYSVVAYIGAEVARGLHAAHAQNPPLVHGALCPGNVFITSRGAIRLLDFGLRAAVRRPFEPRPRRLLPYIAPELAAPAAEGTMAGDMYSLGVLLCELGSGGLPPQGRRTTEMQIALSLLPEDLGLLIGRLVSVSPAARPAANDAVAALAAAHRDTTETDLVGTLASLVQHFANDRAAPQEPPEAVVSLGGGADDSGDVLADGAAATLDEAPPPPSDVEHDDAYGVEVSQVTRVPEPPRAAPAVPAPDFSRPPPGPRDDFYGSSEPTTVGKPALIDDLVAKSRPSAARASLEEARAKPPRVPTSPAGSPILVPDPATSVPTVGEPRRGTLRSFGPSTSTATGAPSENNTGISGEWTERPPSKSRPRLTPTSAPAHVTVPGETEPTLGAPMESAEEVMVPSAAFDAPPATWGARALAALGGQAGIEPASGNSSGSLGLLDEVQLAPSDPIALAGSPPLHAEGNGSNGRWRSPQALALNEPPIGRHRAPAGALPSELGSDLGMPANGDEAAAGLQDRAEANVPRDPDSLLEDHLVDAPDAGRLPSSWAQADPSGIFGLVEEATAIPPPPEGDPFPQQPSGATATVAAAADAGMRSARGDEAFLDDGGQRAAGPAYFDDSGQPESEISAPPEAPAARAPARVPPAPARYFGGEGSVARRAAPQPGSVPSWVKSPPDTHSGRRPRRRLVWGIVGSVLGASIVLGGLAGFFVGSRGKQWSAMLGLGRPPALSKPRAAGARLPLDDDATPPTLGHSAGVAAAKAPATGSAGPAPLAAKTAPAAKAAGVEKAPVGKAAEAAPGIPARAPGATHKQVTGAADATPANWNRGVSDSGGALVSVTVRSRPAGAAVWINGKERGLSPVQVKIQAGPARVVMVLAGHASATADVTASEGAEVSRELPAIDPPMTGEARFRAECTTVGKLPIVVDGKETGVLCPFSKLRVDPGVHKIGLFVPALGKVHEKEVTLHPGVRSIVFAD